MFYENFGPEVGLSKAAIKDISTCLDNLEVWCIDTKCGEFGRVIIQSVHIVADKYRETW